MKIVKQIIFWTIIYFILLTLLTIEEKAYVDGLNQYGFPLRFYIYGYCQSPECMQLFGFKYLPLFADIFIISSVVFLTLKLNNKLFKSNNNTTKSN
ncbi:MAG: hypothetical protein HXX18_13895 [Bacteroidetes bacterium]|nr:hypothetical protein [Bacteroidota bacterium]